MKTDRSKIYPDRLGYLDVLIPRLGKLNGVKDSNGLPIVYYALGIAPVLRMTPRQKTVDTIIKRLSAAGVDVERHGSRHILGAKIAPSTSTEVVILKSPHFSAEAGNSQLVLLCTDRCSACGGGGGKKGCGYRS